jgi:hypothetical protein
MTASHKILASISTMLCLSSCDNSHLSSSPQAEVFAASEQTFKIFDACSNTWLNPKITISQEEIEQKPRIIEKSLWIDRTYQVNDQKMRLYNVDIYHLNEYIKGGKSPLPKSLRGVWWMDGNPLPEAVLSFGDAEVSQRHIKNPYNGPNSYLFSATAKGRLNWDVTNFFKTGMVIRPSANINLEEPKPGDTFYVDVDARFVGSIVSENMPTRFVDEGHWRRETIVGSSKPGSEDKRETHCYNFRRIVDENGKKLPIYPYFVQEILKKNSTAGSRVPEVVMQIRPTDQ